MARGGFSGLDQILKLFDTLPQAAEAELKDELPKIGAAVLAAQKEAVPVRTGELWRGLTTQVINGGRTVRVGLIGVEGARSGKMTYPLYYGRFVEFGRRGQVVHVQRRRRVKGALRSRRGRKIAEDIVATYNLRVTPMAPRHFVYSPGSEAAAFDAGVELAEFWDRVLGRAGA